MGSESIGEIVRAGLSRLPKALPSFLLYDREGSRLFEMITRLPEYYLTRCESEILSRSAPEILSPLLGASDALSIVEFGSGSAEKTRVLIRAAVDSGFDLVYVPIDISAEFLEETASRLRLEFPELAVKPIAAEYGEAISMLAGGEGSRLFIFLGSNIGNFDPLPAKQFLASLCDHMGGEDRLLIGIDLAKDPSIIGPAYDDAEGVTAAFGKNILARINRELGGHFDLGLFDHRARYAVDRGRVEMYLASHVAQEVSIDDLAMTVSFEGGETIHTENSYKYTSGGLADIAFSAGLCVEREWRDEKGWFSDLVLRVCQ